MAISIASRPPPDATAGGCSKNGLYYTKWGLIAVFFYLLVGDFCLQFMELVIPSIMPLQLDACGASDTLKATVLGSIMFFFNMALNPYISFKSDNMRTAWGRRRPILIWTAPLVTLSLILVAYAPEVAGIWKGWGMGPGWLSGVLPKDPSMAMMVLTLAFFVIVFQLVNYLMAPVFYYLFVDVVPDAYMGRFISIFRIVATLAGYSFNLLVFPHAMAHTRAIYLGAAALYGAGFLFMSLMVKEGTYPPPAHARCATPGDKIRVFVKECYSHPHYLLFNARNTCWVLSCAADMFLVFYLTKSLKVSLLDIGTVGANSQLLLLLLLYPLGVLVDTYKPMRVVFYLMLICLPLPLVNFFFIDDRLSYLVLGFATVVMKGIIGNLDLPFYASVPPQDRYGQFGSANQLIVSVVMIPGSALAGKTMDLLTQGGTHPERYRYCFMWSFVFFCASTLFMYFLYRSWRAHGGPENYVPPSVIGPSTSSLGVSS